MQKDVTYTVTEQETGQKIETILKQGLSLTKNQIKSAKFRPDGICVNGNRARISTVVFSGDVVSVQLETKETASGHLEAAPGDVKILYEDEDLLLVNKPAGLVVHPAHGHYDDTLANHLMYYFKQHGLRVCVRAVGRLDKDTSGIVLFAKNKVAAARLSGQNAIEKEYLALVNGRFAKTNGCIKLPIRKKNGSLNQMEISDDGNYAVTHYQVVGEFADYSLVCLKLDTGRTHQIRVHMAAVGHPLVGDTVYGKRRAYSGREMARTALHCVNICLRQPFTGEMIQARAPIPEDMRMYMENFKETMIKSAFP